MKRYSDPGTVDEWRGAALAGESFLTLDSMRQYGLIEGLPVINADRCREIIARARKMGIRYTEKDKEVALVAIFQELAGRSPDRPDDRRKRSAQTPRTKGR